MIFKAVDLNLMRSIRIKWKIKIDEVQVVNLRHSNVRTQQ